MSLTRGASVDYKAVMRRFLDELWNEGNLAVVDELLAPDAVVHNSITGSQRGRANIKEAVMRLTMAFPDFTLTVHDILADGDTVVVRSTARGTYRGPMPRAGIPPTGREFAVSWVSISRFAGGRIVEGWIVWDTLAMLQQIGVIPRGMEATGG